LYLKNSGTGNLTITQIKISGINCNIYQNLSSGVSGIDLSNCLENLTSGNHEILVLTNNKVISKQLLLDIETLVASLIFSSNSSSINYGSSINLSWEATYLDSCTSSGNWSGSKNLIDSTIEGPLISDSTFTLNCTGRFGNITSTLNIEVGAQPVFISMWNTSLSGDSNSTQITLPLVSSGTYDFIVNWGDGTNNSIST
jgi:hypothetical protein